MQDVFIMRLVSLMEENNMSQITLSNLIGTTNVSISRYVSGERKPRIEIVEKMAEVFHVSVDYLLGISNTRTLPNGKVKITYPNLQRKIDYMGKMISKQNFTKEQVLLIEKLLETNINFISELQQNQKSVS